MKRDIEKVASLQRLRRVEHTDNIHVDFWIKFGYVSLNRHCIVSFYHWSGKFVGNNLDFQSAISSSSFFLLLLQAFFSIWQDAAFVNISGLGKMEVFKFLTTCCSHFHMLFISLGYYWFCNYNIVKEFSLSRMSRFQTWQY